MNRKIGAVAVLLSGVALVCSAETLLDLPVSSVGNAAYLTSMSSRPWWDKAWTRRAPLLVGSASEVPDAKALVDVTVDFGEQVNPDEVRVVTPWETEIPCEAEKGEKETSVRLRFRAPFRIQENRPFLVYWGNPNAKRAKVRSCVTLEETEDEFRLANGLLEVTFDRRGRTAGPIKSIRLLSSQADNELLGRATGYAWAGFELSTVGKPQPFAESSVAADGAWTKTVRFSNAQADVCFTLAADSPRIDWTYRLKGGAREATLSVSWLVGGDTAYDDLVYPGTAGRPLALRAGLDEATDNIPQPEYQSLGDYVADGWVAIRDRRAHEAVGILFDRAAMRWFSYWGHGQASGERMNLSFGHGAAKDGAAAEQSGSLVVLRGDAEDVRTEYRRRAKPMLAFVGAAEPYAEHPAVKPRFDHDFVADFNIGFDAGMGWRSGEPLDDPAWADNIMTRIRAYGANAARLGHYGDYTPYMKLSKDLHDRLRAVAARPGSSLKDSAWPEWSPERYDGRRIAEYCAAAHRRGMGVSNWSHYLGLGIFFKAPGKWTDPELSRLDREVQQTFADSGVDVVNCLQACAGEGPVIPEELAKAQGTTQFWQWKDPSVYFDQVVEAEHERLRLTYEETKKRHPEACFMVFTSENGEISREKFMGEFSGLYDSAYVEMLPQGDLPKCKYVAKRLRALFGNEAGRTIHHHFYFYDLTERQRINEVEMPFLCGINGFSTENLTYEHHDREYSEIPADFYRFAEYTRLGAKAARMAPVRDLAVFRDDAAFRADVIAHRTVGHEAWDTFALNDRRVEAFGSVRNLAWDVVINRFFTKEALAKYRVVYVPSDEVFSDALAKELLAFVEAGGGAVLEGATATACETVRKLGLRDGEVRTYGKGRLVVRTKNLSEDLKKGGAKAHAELRKVLASVGSRPPYAVSDDRLDTVLQASGEGMMLGVYNHDAKDAVKASVTFDARLLEPNARPLFALDVKTGRRVPFAGTLAVEAAPRQTAYYLVGPDDFASVPSVRPVPVTGGLAARCPQGVAPKTPKLGTFEPAKAIEFVWTGKAGKPVVIRRSHEAMIERTAFVEADAVAFAKALKSAAYVHLQAQTDVWDPLFETCAAELKAFLARGGGILFDKQMPGRRARKFLSDVGVPDPSPSIRTGVGDGLSRWSPSVPTNTPLFAVISPGFSKELHYSFVFSKWDAAKQLAPFRPNLADDHAVVVAQEGVCGKGKVLFSTAGFTFGDYYENKNFGNSVLSWFIGRPVADHAALVRARNGGPGEPER